MAEHSTVARPYARAVFAITAGSADLEAWSQALHAAAAVVEDSRARAILANPASSPGERAEFVRKVLADTPVSAVTESERGQNLLRILSENDRLAALPEIAAQFDKLKSTAENKVGVRLVTAAAVDKEQVEKIARALETRLGRSVAIEVEQDSQLVGGAVVRADDRVIDGSVKSRLQRLAAALIG